MKTRQGLGLKLPLLLLSALGANCAFAQSYPTKPVHLFAAGAGGGNDVAARVIAPELSAALGQPVVVENRAPAVLVTGVASAAPDGYSILVGGGSLWTSTLFQKQPYSMQDFAPIAMLTRTPYIIMVTPSLPVKTIAELVKLAQAKPGELNHSTGSTGSGSHIAAESLKSMAGLNMVRIPYNDEREITDLMSGRVHMSIGSAAQWGALIKSGKVRALATGGAQRSLFFPDLPTVSETIPGYLGEQLLGLLAPGKTPEAILRRLNQETARGLAKPEVRDRLLKGGLEPASGTPEQFADVIKAEMTRVEKMIKDSGIKPEAS